MGSVEVPDCHHGAIGYGGQGVTAFAIQVNPQMPAVNNRVEPVLAEVPVVMTMLTTSSAGLPSDLLAKCPSEIGISAPSTRTVAARWSTCCKQRCMAHDRVSCR